jgi:hypothetical protein
MAPVVRPMRASRTPPTGYVPAFTVTLSRRLVIWLNLASLPLLAVWAALFVSLAGALRPDSATFYLPTTGTAAGPDFEVARDARHDGAH